MALPALQVRVPNPANALLQASQIKGAQAQNRALQRQEAGQNALLTAFQGGVPTTPEARTAAVNTVAQADPMGALSLQQHFSGLDAQKQALAAQEARTTARVLFGVVDQPSYTAARATLPPGVQAKLPEQYDPNVVRSTVQMAQSIDSMAADRRATLPTPPLSDARQDQELAQIAARRTPTAPTPRTDLGKISADLSNGFTTPAQALRQSQNALAPTETWRPMSAEERTTFGIPEGRAAQISSNGKGSVIGSSGGITLFDRDGRIMAQVGGQPLTNTQQGAQAIEISDKIRTATTRIAELDNSLQQLIRTPQATGLSGLAIEKVGGVLEQVTDLVGVDNNWLPTAEVQRVRSDLAALLGQYIPVVTGDDSGRYSDQDARRADAALPTRNPTASFGQVKSGLETMRDIEVRSRARALMRGDGFAPGIDLTYNEGRQNYASQLMSEGKTPQEAASIIIDLVDKYGIPLTVQGIQ